MLNVLKDRSYKVADAVMSCFTLIANDGSDVKGDVYVIVRLTKVGGYSAMLLTCDDPDKKDRYAWIKEARSSDSIEILLGNEHTVEYDLRRGHIPKDDIECEYFRFDEHYAAAKAVYDYLVGPHVLPRTS